MPEIPTYVLNDGNALPAVGFGTYPLKGEDGTDGHPVAPSRPATA